MQNILLLNLHSIKLEDAAAWAAAGLYFIIKDGKLCGLCKN